MTSVVDHDLEQVAEDVRRRLGASRQVWVVGNTGSGGTPLSEILVRDENIARVQLLDLEETDATSHAMLQAISALPRGKRSPLFEALGNLTTAAEQVADALARAGLALVIRSHPSWETPSGLRRAHSASSDDDTFLELRRRQVSGLLRAWMRHQELRIVLITRRNAQPDWLKLDARVYDKLPLQPPTMRTETLLRADLWEHYAQAAHSLHGELDDLEASSPVALRLGVGACSLGVPANAVAQTLRQRRPAKQLVDFICHRLHDQALSTAVDRFLMARSDLPRAKIAELTQVPSEHTPLLTQCLGYGESAVRMSSMVRDLMKGRRTLCAPPHEGDHLGFANYYEHEDGVGDPVDLAPIKMYAWLEKVHHLALSGDRGADRWEDQELPAPEFYWERGRYLSKECGAYEAAADVYARCTDRFGDDHYAWHYKGFNLAKAGLDPREAREAYQRAVDLDDANPWWNARLVTYLVQMGQFGAARQAWSRALDQIDPDGDRVARDLWLAEQLHHWVARAWLAAGEVAEAQDVLSLIPEEQLQESSRLRQLAHAIADAVEAELLGHSVYPSDTPMGLRWTEPRFLPAELKGVPRDAWFPARVLEKGSEDVGVVYAVPTDPPDRRRIALTQLPRSEWDVFDLGDAEFVELGRYGGQVLVVPADGEPAEKSPDLEAALAYLRRWNTA